MGRPGRPTRHEAAAGGGDLSALLPVPVPVKRTRTKSYAEYRRAERPSKHEVLHICEAEPHSVLH
jgi:hypothetical protein